MLADYLTKCIIDYEDGIILNCKIKPSSNRNSIDSIFDNKLKIFIKAQPENNKANNELIKYLSKLLDLPKSSLSIISGSKSQEKRILFNCKREDIINKFTIEKH